jgi:hypothetical protein
MHAGGEEFLLCFRAALARPLRRRQIDAAQQAVAADVGDLF